MKKKRREAGLSDTEEHKLFILRHLRCCSEINGEGGILEALSLNRSLSNVSLCITKRKPFDVLAEQTILNKSRGDWT